MKKLLFIAGILLSLTATAQTNNAKLEELLLEKVDTIQGISGRWELVYQSLPMLVITDEANDRMRIIAPITEVEKLDNETLTNALVANFHSALDVKYAISDDIMWSAFIHPLSPLTEYQVKDALKQVYYATATFGSIYSSTELSFPESK